MSDVAIAFARTQIYLREVFDRGYGGEEDFWRTQNAEKFRQALEDCLRDESAEVRARILAEYFSYGPLDRLLADSEITEILVNGPTAIWLERQGRLEMFEDCFLSESSYLNSLHRLCEKARCQSSVEHPATTGFFQDFRLTLVRQELTRNHHHLSLRRHPESPWTLQKLADAAWADEEDIARLRTLIRERKNFLIVGNTGSGKTSLINALLQEIAANERAIVIEDTPEIHLPNTSSMKLVTREDPQGVMKPVTQSDLLRHSLRLRPDRLVLGEIRGAEAKDLLMALATGHGGSFGTLHASDPRQALIRLEMLIQMGAPSWNLQAVRRLIQLSLDYILVVEKMMEGKRKFQGTYKICSLEENGFLVEKA